MNRFAVIVMLAACSPNARPEPDAGAADESYTCDNAARDHGYVGCEYWPVDLDNAIEVLGAVENGCNRFGASTKKLAFDVCWDGAAPHGLCEPDGSCPTGFTCANQEVCVLDAQHSPFAIVVANPDTANPVTATLANAAGTTATVTVDAGGVQALFPQELGFPDASEDNAGIAAKAYKLTTDRPIVAYQFNPLDDVGVFSNDASLLIPTHTYATDYLVMTYRTLPRRPVTNDYHGYATVVGVGPGPTTVTITPTTDVDAGSMMIPKGSQASFTLAPFETLNLEARAVPEDLAGGDLTGSSITCSQPCGVFVGHEATTVTPAQAPMCCADHLEEQLFPASTWGKQYELVTTMTRHTPEPDVFRILAQRDNTQLAFSAPQSTCPPILMRGQFCEIATAVDVELTSTEPVLVGHYLQGNGGLGSDSGDPSLAFPAPVEQFRVDYTLLVPAQYNASYIDLVTPSPGQVFVDGVEMVGLSPVGNGFKAGRFPVAPGPHHLSCPSRCGVEVYGWANAVSYLFAGGLDLAPIID